MMVTMSSNLWLAAPTRHPILGELCRDVIPVANDLTGESENKLVRKTTLNGPSSTNHQRSFAIGHARSRRLLLKGAHAFVDPCAETVRKRQPAIWPDDRSNISRFADRTQSSVDDRNPVPG
jgi:hypothetical protein